MVERVRRLFTSLTGKSDDRRFVSRAEREDRQRRILIIVTAVLALGVVVTLAAGAVWQYVLVPRETYATVNGVDIRRSDYEKFRIYLLLQELTSLSQQLQSASEDQQAGIQQQLALLQVELEDLENGDKNINPEALQVMIENELILQGLDDYDIVITDQEVDDYIDELLAPVPLNTPSPTFTIPPTAAAWATETTEAFFEQSTATSESLETATAEAEEAGDDGDGTPAPDETPDATTEDAATPDEDEPDATATEVAPTLEDDEPDATGTEAEDAGTPTPDPDADATFTPVPTLEPTATPNREEAISTARAGFELLEQNFLDRAEMSRGDFARLVARPQLARNKLREALIQEIPTSQEQVRASHILVATRDAALELIDGRLQNEDFADVAEEVSTDESSAIEGGDLGWFPRGVMTPSFEEAAFNLPVDELSEPVQSEFGWHIILVTGHEDDRPLTTSALSAVQQNAVQRWLDEQQEQASISASVPLPEDDEAPQAPIGF